MKCVVTTDLHLGIQKNDNIWVEQTKKLIIDIIDECHRRDIYTLCILGDIFHDRKTVGVKPLLMALEIADLLKTNNIHTFMIIGNHDTFYKTEIDTNTLKIFDEYDNIEVVRAPTILGQIGLMSWNHPVVLPTRFLFGHFEINGFPVTNKLVFEKSAMNVADFVNYEKVISGHFHIPSQRENITYLGSPYHTSFNDVGSLRGYYIFDDADGSLEFIEFGGIKFVYVSTEETPDPKKITGNIVKLIYEEDYGTVENNNKMEAVQALGPIRFYSDFTKISKRIETSEKEDMCIDLKDTKQILFDYISVTDIPKHLDVSKLKSILSVLLEDI